MGLTNKARNERIASNRLIILLSTLLFISFTIAILSYFHIENWFAYNTRYAAEVAKQQILAQQLAKYSLMAPKGEKNAFVHLRKGRNDLHNSMLILKQGDPDAGLPPSPKEVDHALEQAKHDWAALQTLVDQILKHEQSFAQIDDSIKSILTKLPKISKTTNDIIKILVNRRISQNQVFIATNQAILIQRIENNLRRIRSGGKDTTEAIAQLDQDIESFGKVLNAMLQSGGTIKIDNTNIKVDRIQAPEARRNLGQLQKQLTPITQEATNLSTIIPNTIPALNAVGKVSHASEVVDKAYQNLLEEYQRIPGRLTILGLPIGKITVLLFGGLVAIFLVLLGGQILTGARRRESESKSLNEANQKAILRLLDEMGDLADGDLTVAATVTEDITGAIADSINYAIEALRGLVTTINITSENISVSSQESRAITMQLTEASELQAQRISQATDVIKQMTTAINGMARDARDSADVAKRAVDIANRGAATVRNTIQGMNTIREQIQDTSKRIKRLGESSQEINEFVDVIDGIADQTNILALNAAMQAAMAGEAGRGFAVVADEVKRLSDNSSTTTKQIENLVKTIQTDTEQAIRSMETSIAWVVKGAGLAEDAGKALEEIEEVSNYIASQTAEIADAAKHESQAAFKVDEGMTVIQDITTKTVDGTRLTAAAIDTLTKLADDLQHSVAGFTLPH